MNVGDIKRLIQLRTVLGKIKTECEINASMLKQATDLNEDEYTIAELAIGAFEMEQTSAEITLITESITNAN